MTAITVAEARLRKSLRIIHWMFGNLPLSAFRLLNTLTVPTVRRPRSVTFEKTTVAGRPAEWFREQGTHKGPVVLYLHGGGFIFPTAVLQQKYVGHLARAVGGSVLTLDYRLAPEHPYPAALDDTLAAYRWLLAQGIAPKRVIVAGDSAGGNLTLALLQALKQSAEPFPAAVVAISPVTDLEIDHASDESTYHDEMLHPRAMRKFKSSYVAGNDPRDPRISPVFGDLVGLPPTLIFAGDAEVLLHDAVAYAEAAQAAGSPVTLHIETRLWHVWSLYVPELPQAVDALAQTVAFVRAHTSVGDAASV
jgi:acetyl esterase/lipase